MQRLFSAGLLGRVLVWFVVRAQGVWPILLALQLLVAQFGCGSNPENKPRFAPQQRASETQHQVQAALEAPRTTVDAMQACADRFAPKLPGESFAVLFDVTIGANGNTVKVKDSMLGGSPLERCLASAFERMAIPDLVANTQQMSPASRSMVGVVQAAAAPVALLPIALAAAGVTILVGATIYVAMEVTDAASEILRCRAVKETCIDHCSGPSGLPAPGGGRFRGCMRECMEAAGCSF